MAKVSKQKKLTVHGSRFTGVPLSRGTSDESYEELGGYTERHKACWLRVIPLHRR